MTGSLIDLEARVRDDLARTAHPDADWLVPKQGPDGKPALDVLVVGAGQSGIATAFGLMRSRVTNILVLDKAGQGREGPWLTYARMPTLRSPKHYTGPDLDVASLTYQSEERVDHLLAVVKRVTRMLNRKGAVEAILQASRAGDSLHLTARVRDTGGGLASERRPGRRVQRAR